MEQELRQNNRWLIQLRWIAAGGIVLSAALAAGPLGYPVPLVKLVLLGVAVAAYNAGLYYVWRRLPGEGYAGQTAGRLLANGQIALDLFALAVLLHLAGGIDNPFCVYFVFHMIIASILLPPEDAYGQALLASGLYAFVLLGEHWGVLPHIVIFPQRGALTLFDVLGHIAVMASALFISVFLTVAVSQRLRQREQELAQALEEVRHYATSCDLAREDLQRTQEMQLQYMRRVSHELRAPLSSVLMTLRALRASLPPEVPEKLQELLQRAEARLETLLDTVGDLLTLSRMRQAPLQEPFSEIAVSHLVEQVLDEMSDIAQQRGVLLEAEMEPGLPPLYGQPEGLRTMLLNLVGNAIKYTPAGGRVTVSVAREEGGGYIVLRVRDTGIGIAPEDLPRIFDEFFRTEAARRLQVHGSGLGLSIVKYTVEAHKGEITVDSELGRGSTFTVRLPSTLLSSPPTTTAPEASASASGEA